MHIWFTRWIDAMPSLEREMQTHLREHCFQGVPFSSELADRCFEAWNEYAAARRVLSEFADHYSIYTRSL